MCPNLAASTLLACGLVSLAPAALAATTVTGYGHAQLTGEHFDDADEDFDTGFDRVRAGAKLDSGQLFGHLQLDFNAEPTRPRRTGTVLNAVQLLFAGWRLNEQHSLTAGQFKTPLGMDFNLPGSDLDITKRGLEAGLVLNRAVGVMLSGRQLTQGLGYDLALLGPAGRSGAVFGVDGDPFDQETEDFTAVARIHFDPDPAWHLQVAVGRAEDAGGADASEDYDVFDIAGRYRHRQLTFKAEYIEGRDVLGTASRDQRVYYLHGGWQLAPRLEAVIRHYAGQSDAPTGERELRNTYYGVNIFLGPDSNRRNGRIQINYVAAGGDEDRWNGVGGITEDAWLLQLQLYGEVALLE